MVAVPVNAKTRVKRRRRIDVVIVVNLFLSAGMKNATRKTLRPLFVV